VLVAQRSALQELLTVAPTGLSNLQNAYNPAAGTLDTRNNAQGPQDPASLLCSILKTTGDDHGDCAGLRKLFGSLPEVPPAPASTGTVDKTLGGLLGAPA
jgi:phospholipid/cholesterol/gamma-HCH transport system substrate-binding protein